MNIGAHVRGGGKLVPSLEAGVEIGATSIQIFTQSPRMWKPSQYAPEVLAAFRDAQAAHPSVTHTFCHATYLINLASPDRELYEKSVQCLISNLSVGRGMASSGVVLHVGSHMGAGFEESITQITEAFERAFDEADAAPPGVVDCPILIENAAGAGGTVGRSLDEIEALINACAKDERLGLCIDTQHLWASGVDYSSVEGTNLLVHEVDRRIGIDRLRCLHLNDSKIDLGGNRDRHANIGEGTIGAKGLAALVGHRSIRDLPLLLEVPGTGDGPRAEDVVAARAVVKKGIKLHDSAPSTSGRAASSPVSKGSSSTTSSLTKAAVTASVVKPTATKGTRAKKAAARSTVPKKAAATKAAPTKAAPKRIAPTTSVGEKKRKS